MSRLPAQDPRSHEPVRERYGPGRADRRSDTPIPIDDGRGKEPGSGLRLPPTRAARPARSRGVFLAVARRLLGPDKPRRTHVSRVTLAVAALAATSALVISAPTLWMDTAVAASRGLALIGAASVPPSFIAKKQ